MEPPPVQIEEQLNIQGSGKLTVGKWAEAGITIGWTRTITEQVPLGVVQPGTGVWVLPYAYKYKRSNLVTRDRYVCGAETGRNFCSTPWYWYNDDWDGDSWVWQLNAYSYRVVDRPLGQPPDWPWAP
jgi:hypothetical protein